MARGPQRWMAAASWLGGAYFLAAIFGSIAHQVSQQPPARLNPTAYRHRWCVAQLMGLGAEHRERHLADLGRQLSGRPASLTPPPWRARLRARTETTKEACGQLGDGRLDAAAAALLAWADSLGELEAQQRHLAGVAQAGWQAQLERLRLRPLP